MKEKFLAMVGRGGLKGSGDFMHYLREWTDELGGEQGTHHGQECLSPCLEQKGHQKA